MISDVSSGRLVKIKKLSKTLDFLSFWAAANVHLIQFALFCFSFLQKLTFLKQFQWNLRYWSGLGLDIVPVHFSRWKQSFNIREFGPRWWVRRSIKRATKTRVKRWICARNVGKKYQGQKNDFFCRKPGWQHGEWVQPYSSRQWIDKFRNSTQNEYESFAKMLLPRNCYSK